MSFWQVSQEEPRRCRQQRHCRHAGHMVPGIEQSNTSQLSSTISPFQYINYLKAKQFGNKRAKNISSTS
jgi:hypothetical protein